MRKPARLGRKSVIVIASCVLLSGFAAQQPPAAMEFLHISDTHVTDLRYVAAPIAKQRAHLVDSERRLAALLAETGKTRYSLVRGNNRGFERRIQLQRRGR